MSVVLIAASAKQGLARAQYNFGWVLQARRGVAKDKILSRKYYTLAAEQGHIDAQQCLNSFCLFRLDFINCSIQ